MCEVDAYLVRKDGTEEKVLEKVYLIEPEENGVRIENLFGEQKVVTHPIWKIDLAGYKLLFKEGE